MHHFLIAESETEHARQSRRAAAGRSSGESYAAAIRAIDPSAECEIVQPVETDERARPRRPLTDYDAVFLAGSPMHVYERTAEVERALAFMRALFRSRTPSFGSCAGLQIAVAAAGGTVRENKRGHEVAFARRLTPTPEGRNHPLLAGRPAVYDALAIHSDEVETLPDGAVLLSTNGVTAVQAAEIRCDGGLFWGVQYHPELPLSEIAAAVRRQGEDVVEQGLAGSRSEVESYADLIDALGQDPERRDLAWRLGIDHQITAEAQRTTELRNFIRFATETSRG